MVTSDFICPSTTLNMMLGNLDMGGSIRVWTLQSRTIVKTIEVLCLQKLEGWTRSRATQARKLE